MCVNLLWCLQQLLRIGVNLKNFPTSAVPATFALLFHLGIAAVLLLYVLFWLKVCLTLCFHLPSSGLQLRVSKSLLLLPNNLISLVWFEDTPSESLESNDLIPFIVSYMLLCFLVSFMDSWICLLHWRLFASWVLSWCLWDTGSFPTLPQHLPNWNLLESERSFLFSIDWKNEGFVEKQWVHFLFNFVGPFLVNYVIHVS